LRSSGRRGLHARGPLGDHHHRGRGNNDYVTIRATDSAEITGLEFLYGNGYSFDPIPTVWETWRDGSLVSSGGFSVVRGTVVGWSDPAGFDELRVASGLGIVQLGDFQAIALDNVRVQIASPDASVPEGGATLVLLAMAAGGMMWVRGGLKRS